MSLVVINQIRQAGGLAPDERCEASVFGWGGGDGVGWGRGAGRPPSLSPGKTEVGTPGGKLGKLLPPDFNEAEMPGFLQFPTQFLPGRETFHDSPFKKIAPFPPP